jgi:AcrR family transcriptional regulator
VRGIVTSFPWYIYTTVYHTSPGAAGKPANWKYDLLAFLNTVQYYTVVHKMGITERRTREKDELRRKILDAATAMFVEEGYENVSMRKIADRIEYAPSTIYLYFKDKNEVLKETVKAAFDDFADTMAAATVGPTALDKMRQRVRAYVVWGIMHPGLYQLMFQVPGEIEWREDDLASTSRGYMDSFAVVQEGIDTGQLKPMADMTQFGVMTWAALHGVVSLAISRRLGPESLCMSGPEIVRLASTYAERLTEDLLAPVLAEK